MFDIQKAGEEYGMDFLICSPALTKREQRNDYYQIQTYTQRKIAVFFDTLFGVNGCFSYFATRKLIRKIKTFDPDIIHLHNLHGSFLNLKCFFSYLKNNNKKVVWTLHDCWSFTGRCPHFTSLNCNKWKTGCYDCAYPKKLYPRVLADGSKYMWGLKRKIFNSIENLTFVTPSKWLADLVNNSFLKSHRVAVINNGIDLSVFKPRTNRPDCLKRVSSNKFILLGVSFRWGKSKGLDVFVELSKRLPDNYQIVLVGTNVQIDSVLPENIISIHRTNNQTELSEIYSLADLFVDPTSEDNYPTVIMEALACGTPVLTYDTGGCSEMLNETCGSVVECNDIYALEKEIIRICETKPYSRGNCLKKSRSFDKNICFSKYISLYNQIIENNSL